MAGLAAPLKPVPVLKPISAAQQFNAIAYLRWRLFVNAFRRKGGKGEFIAKFFIYPVFFLFIVGPSAGAGFGSYAAVHYGHLGALPGVFFAVFLLQIVVSINVSPPGLSFDPEALIRFPVTFPRYLTVRLFLGLLSAANVIGTVALFAAATGITVAQPSLAAIAFPAAILLAIANVFFLRMVFAWVDRWLSTRRARELFTGLILLSSVGIQWLNVTFNPGFHQHDMTGTRRKYHAIAHTYQASRAILWHLHPGLAGAAIVRYASGAVTGAVLDLLGLALFAALFLAIFAWRMEREYRGESLSDNVIPQQPQHAAATHTSTLPPSAAIQPAAFQPDRNLLGLSAPVAAAFGKELIYIRRNSAQLYAMVLPLVMVFLFAGKLSAGMHSVWVFPAAIAYSTLTMAPLAYNALGLDASGVQFYFLAPIRFRSILLAKNLFSFALILVQAAVVFAMILYMAGPPPLWILLATLAWLPFTVFLNLAAGNIRSITAPKKMDPSKLSRKQTSQLSALLSVLLILVLAAIGFGILFLGQWLAMRWLPAVILLALAAGTFALYTAGLTRLDTLALNNRETLIEELTKAS